MLSKAGGGADFDYRLARYGPGVGSTEALPAAGGVGAGRGAQAVAVADPFDGCDDKAYKASPAGLEKSLLWGHVMSGINLRFFVNGVVRENLPRPRPLAGCLRVRSGPARPKISSPQRVLRAWRARLAQGYVTR